MKILVVWSPDGDMYFKATKKGWSKALVFATEMVLHTYERYELEDKERLRNKNQKQLKEVLIDISAIREEELQD